MKIKNIISILFLSVLLMSFKHKQYSPSKKTINIYKKHRFYFSIPSNLGTGYQWKLYDTTNVKLLSHTAKSNPNTLQSADLEIFKLRPLKKGKFALCFYYVRIFEIPIDTAHAKKITQKINIK